MALTSEMKNAAKIAWNAAAMKKAGMVKVLDPDEIIETVAPYLQDAPTGNDYEKALRDIANLWPIDTCAKIGDVFGINDGKSRAIIAEGAVSIARKALGIERMP